MAKREAWCQGGPGCQLHGAPPKRALVHQTERQVGLCGTGEEAEGPWAPGGCAWRPSLGQLPATLPKPSCSGSSMLEDSGFLSSLCEGPGEAWWSLAYGKTVHRCFQQRLFFEHLRSHLDNQQPSISEASSAGSLAQLQIGVFWEILNIQAPSVNEPELLGRGPDISILRNPPGDSGV